MFPYHHSKESSSLLLLAQVCSRVPKKQVVTSGGGLRVFHGDFLAPPWAAVLSHMVNQVNGSPLGCSPGSSHGQIG
jgi:hypothetical protein